MAKQNDFKNQLVEKKETNTAPAKQKSPRQHASDLLERMAPEIEKALPAHMSQERMTRIALSAVNANPKLLDSITQNPTSFLGALMQSAQLGLEPNTNLGHAYLIPYGQTVSLQLGYLGLLELAYRSGQYQKIMAMPVYKDDFFEYQYGTNEKLNHIPAPIQTGDPVGYYAYYNLTNGGQHFVYWSMEKVKLHKQHFSKAGNIWQKNFDAMALKTVIKDVLKYAPKSIEMSEAVVSDNNDFELNDKGTIIDVTNYDEENKEGDK